VKPHTSGHGRRPDGDRSLARR
jgi:hypothetical protein